MTTQATRFWSRVLKTDTCWLWEGAKNSWGYGQFYPNGRKSQVRAHRFAFEETKGKIPNEMVLDHLCKNKACINPSHLEIVTSRENTLRGESPLAKFARQTHCLRGHILDEKNTYYPTPFKRYCRKCRIIRQRKHRQNKANRQAEGV